ncbi:MAG: Fur family transcriptional regulator [Planctomycetaceae bacterium]
MSRSPRRQNPPPADPFAAARATIREAGLRCTPARIAVLERLAEAPGPSTHAEIAALLAPGAKGGGFGIDKATVYRNLVELTDAGILSRIEVGDHVWRFELRKRGSDGSVAADHPHFVCTECGAVSCLEGVEVTLSPHPEGSGAAAAGRDARRAARRDPRKEAPRAADSRRRIGSVSQVLLKGRCKGCD